MQVPYKTPAAAIDLAAAPSQTSLSLLCVGFLEYYGDQVLRYTPTQENSISHVKLPWLPFKQPVTTTVSDTGQPTILCEHYSDAQGRQGHALQ